METEESPRSRHKLLVGCAIAAGVVLVLVVAGGIGAYLSVRHITGPLMYLSGSNRLESGIVNTSEYQPPASGVLTAGQLERFLAVEREVESRLEERFAELRTKSAELIGLSQAGKVRLPARATLESLGPVGRALLEGKQAQVDALNRVGLSKDEFEWIREQAYHAAGVEAWQLDYSDVIGGVAGAEFAVRRLPHGVAIPAENRTLVAPRADDLKRWVTLAFFGL